MPSCTAVRSPTTSSVIASSGSRSRWPWWPISLIGLFTRGLALGIEFKGGVEYQANVKVTSSTVDDFTGAVKATNAKDLGDPVVTTIGPDKVRVQTDPLAPGRHRKVRAAIAKEAGVTPDQVAPPADRRVLGSPDREQGDLALVVFLVLSFR